MQLFVLITIDGRTTIITATQRAKIAALIENGSVKAVNIGTSLIMLHQVTGIVEMETYKRQMRSKLALRKQRMCGKCGTVVGINESCPCRDRPDKFPELLEAARSENPELAAELDRLAASKAISSPANVQRLSA